MIYCKTNLEKMPGNCMECNLAYCRGGLECHIPWYGMDRMRKPCQRKRPANCPLEPDGMPAPAEDKEDL